MGAASSTIDDDIITGIPYTFYVDNRVRFWVHYGLVILGFLLAAITAIVQWIKPAPYGKHETNDNSWGAPIPQRLGHILSDFIPGVILFLLIFFFYGSERGIYNYVFLSMFLLHYVHRGLIHPITMRYSKSTVALGITLGGFFPNCIYHFINADFIGSAHYVNGYYYDPRFIIGILLFVTGYIINRWADIKLRSLRHKQGVTRYYIPYGGLFEFVSCPNYFGELVEWIGWSIATFSLAGLVWCLFSAATFIPRARHNHLWYKSQFELYPRNRKALIPFVL